MRTPALVLLATTMLASVVAACAGLQGLDQYSVCSFDCDTGGDSDLNGGADAKTPESSSSSSSGGGDATGDTTIADTDGEIDAPSDDDAGAVDSGNAADALEPHDAAGPVTDADAGSTVDAADATSAVDAADAGKPVDASSAGDASTAGDAGSASDASGPVDASGTSDAADSSSAVDASEAGSGADAAGAKDASTTSDASDGAASTCAIAGVDAGLLVYLPFEGTAVDSSGNANNGIALTGTDVSYGPGALGQGVTILTTGQGIAVTGGTLLSGAKTLCAWVNPSTGTIGESLPVFTAGSNYLDIEATALPTAGACLGLVANTLFMDNGACSETALAVTPGSWNFVCYAYGVGSTTFYANASSQTVTGNQYDPYLLAQITVGSDRIGGSTTRALFVGEIDEVSVWSGWLPASAVNALYNGGHPCPLR